MKNTQGDLLIEADSVCSLILHRERGALSEQTLTDLKSLCDKLRTASDAIVRERRSSLAASTDRQSCIRCGRHRELVGRICGPCARV